MSYLDQWINVVVRATNNVTGDVIGCTALKLFMWTMNFCLCITCLTTTWKKLVVISVFFRRQRQSELLHWYGSETRRPNFRHFHVREPLHRGVAVFPFIVICRMIRTVLNLFFNILLQIFLRILCLWLIPWCVSRRWRLPFHFRPNFLCMEGYLSPVSGSSFTQTLYPTPALSSDF